MSVVALAQGRLAGPELQHTEQHLERCELCRATFRQQTADRFPKFPNYTILAELGRGGFGAVYKAVHHGKERIEALKVLFGTTALREAYFENEVHLAARLRHPNIATLYEAHLSKSPRYYSMEFVAGQDLDDYLRTHEVSLERRIEIVRTVAAAVGYAHREGVIHRDLKPQNIVIDSAGQPRILDFGIAKRLGPAAGGPPPPSPAGPSEGVLGTYGYMSPEQVAGQPVDERSDVYSLGALLFHVITGQPARFAPEQRRLTEILHERHVSRADDLAAIIACCVQTLPDNRYPSCAALIEDLDHYLACRPIRARRDPTPGYRAARIGALVLRNFPGTVQLVGVLAVTLLLALIFWKADLRWLAGADPGAGSPAALIAFTPQTEAALRAGRLGADLPGLVPGNRKSWRLLYGRLMERLAEAAPRVIAWDYYFPDPQPEFDPAFVRGVQAAGVPVIVGAGELDVNGEPVISSALGAAVHGCGALYFKRADFLRDEVFVALALQRGFNPVTPSLALAAFAAARHPDCVPEVRADRDALELRYRKRNAAPGEPRWRSETDPVPVFKQEDAGARHTLVAPGDRLFLGRYQLARVVAWRERAIPLEAVLAAPAERLRQWFAGRAVVIGELSPRDEYPLQSGQTIFGCQLHAHVLETLLGDTQFRRFSRTGLALRVGLWSALAAVLVNRLRTRAAWPLRAAAAVSGVLVVLGVAAGVVLGPWVTTAWTGELLVAACALLTAGGLALLVRLLHQRQLRLTPGPTWSAEGTTISTALLATTTQDSPPAGG